MKIALIYRGNYIRNRFKFSFSNAIENHKTMVHKFFPDCDMFFSTSPKETELDNSLLKLCKWKAFNFTKDNTCVFDSIDTSLRFYDFSKYDLIVNLRFDLKFNKPLCMFDIDYDKFNFVWLEPPNFNQNNNTRVCDLMYVFPTKYLKTFLNIDLEDSSVRYTENRIIGPPDQAHHLMQFLHLDQKTQVNFMIDGYHASGGERKDPYAKSFLEIHRGK